MEEKQRVAAAIAHDKAMAAHTDAEKELAAATEEVSKLEAALAKAKQRKDKATQNEKNTRIKKEKAKQTLAGC